MLGAMSTFAVLLIVGFTVAFSGGLPWVIGGEAEKWTSEVLAKIPQYAAFHNVVFAEGEGEDRIAFDIDHVVVGPFGILVVESKFSGQPLDLGRDRWPKQVRRDAAQVARNVKRVRECVANAAPGIPIRPLLIYWGGKVTGLTEGSRSLGRVLVVVGRASEQWLRHFTNGGVTDQAVQAATSAIRNHEQSQEQED